MTYREARRLLEKARDPSGKGKLIANNTRLIDRGDHFAIRLHYTDILRIYPDGSYQLFTGGWYTQTTKNRINWFAPCHIYQRKRVWYVSYPRGKDVPFREGMVLHPGGSITTIEKRDGMLARLVNLPPEGKQKQI